VGQPHTPGLPVATAQALQLCFGHTVQRQGRPHQQAAGHRFVQPEQTTQQFRTALPVSLSHIAAFGVDPGKGQVMIAVMLQMAVAIQGVGIPQGKRGVAQHFVKAIETGGMAMQQFVLHRHP